MLSVLFLFLSLSLCLYLSPSICVAVCLHSRKISSASSNHLIDPLLTICLPSLLSHVCSAALALRIRRCQSLAMWVSQLRESVDVPGQLEALHALAHIQPSLFSGCGIRSRLAEVLNDETNFVAVR